MKQKNLAMLGVAVGCGLVAAVAVAKLSAGGPRGPETDQGARRQEGPPGPDAARREGTGQPAGWADMPKNLVPPDAVTDIEAGQGEEPEPDPQAGQPAVEVTDLGQAKKLIMPDGFKAMSVKATPVDAVAGFVKPGDRSGHHVRGEDGEQQDPVGHPPAEDAGPGALNTTNTRATRRPGRPSSRSKSATLAVNDRQGSLLALADEKGKLKLLLTDAGAGRQYARRQGGQIEWMDDPFDVKPARRWPPRRRRARPAEDGAGGGGPEAGPAEHPDQRGQRE